VTLDARVLLTLGTLELDVHLAVAPNEVVAIVGPNGAGKRTLLRALCGLLAVDAGRITLGEDVLDDPDADVFVPAEHRPVGVVFQDGLLFAHLTVRDNVAFGLRARGTPKRDADARASALLEQMSLGSYASAKPPTLSGGQAQRVALARALAITPRMLLLDEPLAALDALSRIDVRRVLRDHLGRYEGVRILVTHDPLEALTLADRIVVLEDGHIVQEGTPAELRRTPHSPYVARLLGINLLRATVDDDARLRVDDSDLTLEAVTDLTPGPVTALFEPSAVTLFLEPPAASARNMWQAVVSDIDIGPDRARVHFDEPVPLVAEVTPSAVRALSLAPGRSVWCAVKATAIDVQAR
jgi:molybdate transport system ATP-binding protein